jgi:hypothetical protein
MIELLTPIYSNIVLLGYLNSLAMVIIFRILSLVGFGTTDELRSG